MKSRLAFAVAAFCIIQYFGNIGPLPRLACAQIFKIEIYPLKTMTLTDEQFLTGVKDGKPDVIAGELRIPRPGNDRLPAMVLVHGSGGVMAELDIWAQELNKIGIATFILDGFTGRGIVDTVTDQRQLGMLTMINDAYRVLEFLSKHPRIDPSRIGIMGGSRGGLVALYASLKRFKRMHGSGDIEFAAYLGFYTPCHVTYIDDDEVSDKPIRLFHGSADDYVPVAPCREYVKRLQKAGKNVQLMEYPDAYHLFDNPAIKAPLRLPEAQTPRNCRYEENPAGQLINSQTKQPAKRGLDPCWERGVTLAYNAQAHSEALKAVKEFLTMTFKLSPMVKAAPTIPDDLQMVQPDPSLPKELAAFWGKWEGSDPIMKLFVIVEKIDEEKATVYSWISGSPAFNIPGGWKRDKADVTKEAGEYRISWRDPFGKIEYHLQGNDLVGHTPGGSARLTRVP